MSQSADDNVAEEGHQHATTAAAAAVESTITTSPPDEHTKPTVDPDRTQAPVSTSQFDGATGYGAGPQIRTKAEDVKLLCGPLLNYRRMSQEAGQPTWHGSVLIVISPGAEQPELTFRCLGRVDVGTSSDTMAANENGNTALPATHMAAGTSGSHSVKGERLYEDPEKGFWRFLVKLPIQVFEARWGYSISTFTFSSNRSFVVPSQTQSMRIMFHSCNGFSVGTDVNAWSGPALWNDVNRMHREVPFHVMIGGGDQIYNDSVRVDGPLKPWTDIGNPKKRRDFLFNEELRARCDDYYYQSYIRWYGTEPFKAANSTIPQLNIWDDHDIIVRNLATGRLESYS